MSDLRRLFTPPEFSVMCGGGILFVSAGSLLCAHFGIPIQEGEQLVMAGSGMVVGALLTWNRHDNG